MAGVTRTAAIWQDEDVPAGGFSDRLFPPGFVAFENIKQLTVRASERTCIMVQIRTAPADPPGMEDREPYHLRRGGAGRRGVAPNCASSARGNST